MRARSPSFCGVLRPRTLSMQCSVLIFGHSQRLRRFPHKRSLTRAEVIVQLFLWHMTSVLSRIITDNDDFCRLPHPALPACGIATLSPQAKGEGLSKMGDFNPQFLNTRHEGHNLGLQTP